MNTSSGLFTMISHIASSARSGPEMDTWDKAPGEVVTSGDIEAERLLAAASATCCPAWPIVGEEATAADASLPATWLAKAPRVWLVEAPRRYGELRRPLA